MNRSNRAIGLYRVTMFLMGRKTPLAYYLIGYEPHDRNARFLEEELIEMSAHRVSVCEWVLQTNPGRTIDLYRTLGRHEVWGFFAQQLDDGFDWHKIAFKADDFLSHLKIS